ncbi:MAG: response regulator [Bacteroidetes bacterium]|nr:response regulator [Bacteroidota bacterium]
MIKEGNQDGWNNLRVLIAEDNEFNRKVLEAQAKEIGFQYAIVENGQQALDVFKEKEFDLILMDIQMPVMDGFQAVNIIRTQFIHPKKDIPIIAITAFALFHDRDKALEAGMDEYLAKPFTSRELKNMICMVLRLKNCLQEDEVTETSVKQTDFDLNEIRRIYNYQEGLIKSIVEAFIRNTSEGFRRISKIMEDDPEETLKILHKLKSSFPYLGMHALYEEILEIEGHLKAEINLPETKERLRKLIDYLPLVYENLKKVIS